ncbi:MAG TPA: glycosyltransferase [Vicinamibacterales bacterium]|nr:glycosyltransferase [Vicinamibacterales bacterium]
MPDARLRVLAIVPSFYPSTVVGVVKPLQRLHQQGRIALDLSIQYLVRRRSIAAADVIVMCGEALPPTRRILQWIADVGRPLVYELDDNRLEVPTDIPGLQYALNAVQQQSIIECLQMAAVVRVYSPYLQDLVRPYNPAVMLVDGPLDWNLVDASSVSPRPTIKTVYATSRLQDTLGLALVEPLTSILDRYAHVELTVWGGTLSALANHPRVRHRRFVRNYDRFFRQFSREHFDIGLAPLPDDDFHRGKSNNKFREYAACGIAGIYSNTPVYNTSVLDGETGLLVGDDPRAWSDAMIRLIEDAPLRRSIGDRARRFARQHYNDEVTGDAWMAALSASRAGTARPRPERPPAAATASASLFAKLVNTVMHNGTAATVRRLGDHASSIAQILSWRLRRSMHAY